MRSRKGEPWVQRMAVTLAGAGSTARGDLPTSIVWGAMVANQ